MCSPLKVPTSQIEDTRSRVDSSLELLPRLVDLNGARPQANAPLETLPRPVELRGARLQVDGLLELLPQLLSG